MNEWMNDIKNKSAKRRLYFNKLTNDHLFDLIGFFFYFIDGYDDDDDGDWS